MVFSREAPKKIGGQGRDRTVDLPIFSRTLVPTELPGRAGRKTDPGRLWRPGDPRRDSNPRPPP